MSEKERINFLEKRDGKAASLQFARQTLDLYLRDAIKHSKYKESIEELKKILEENGIETYKFL